MFSKSGISKTEERWKKWDKMMENGDFVKVVQAFDEMFMRNERIVIGDMIRRDDCLKALGVSLIRENAVYQRGDGGRPKK